MSKFFHRPQVPNKSQIADDYIVFSNTIINACETISHTLHHLAHTIKVFFCGNLAFVLWSAKWQLFNTVKKNTIGMFTALFGALKPPGNCFLNHKFIIMLTQRRSSTPVVSYVITDNWSCVAKSEQTSITQPQMQQSSLCHLNILTVGSI